MFMPKRNKVLYVRWMFIIFVNLIHDKLTVSPIIPQTPVPKDLFVPLTIKIDPAGDDVQYVGYLINNTNQIKC